MSKHTKVGDIIRVQFNSSTLTYGRILIEGSYAFYDCLSNTEREDFENIIESDILFVARVDIFAIKDGFWSVVKNIPLEEGLASFYPLYFNPVPTNPVNINFYQIYKEKIEEAIKKDWIKTGKMQLGGIYSREHIEKRLNDYYQGKKHDENDSDISFFKKLAGFC